MPDDILLPDDLLRQLMAAGQVDILVGIPTLNHAGTIAPVVRAVQAAFDRQFARQRTLMINVDLGSTDGTIAALRDASTDEAATLSASASLRTMHRISTPYHGLPGKGHALKWLFAAADLSQARVLTVIDPDVVSLTPEWIAALAAPVWNQKADFVGPRYQRHPLDGPLVTQLVRPIMRATYGWRVDEPVAPEFACSPAFVSRVVEDPVWTSELANLAIDIWLTGTALAGGYRYAQAQLGPRQIAAGVSRPGVQDVFRQVADALFACVEIHAPYWLARGASEEVPTFGTAPAGVPPAPALDGERLAAGFGASVRDLRALLAAVLEPGTLAHLLQEADAPTASLRVPDELWAATVCQLLAAAHAGQMSRDHVTQALLPIYLGRAGSFVMEHASSDTASVEAALDSLGASFEARKSYLVGRWTESGQR